MNEEKHILTKLEKIYFGKKENEKLTMHEIGVVLDYVALLEQNNRYKNEEIERLNKLEQLKNKKIYGSSKYEVVYFGEALGSDSNVKD